MRFYADDDSFNENLVKENWSEISGRWELKMAALRGRGGGKEEVMGDSRGAQTRERTQSHCVLVGGIFCTDCL